jgi:dTDP-4-dehydrorhamnose reductase
MTRWLVTGAQGQLGSDLVKLLDGKDVVGTSRADLDITDGGAVLDAMRSVRPTIVVNTAAYTAVDAAETDADTARMVNEVGAGNVAAACAEVDALLVHLSTDYVFSGETERPYTEDVAAAPLSTYGRTKLAGEHAVARLLRRHYIVRTSWLYGSNGSDFVSTMLRFEQERDTVRVVDDQHGSPTLSDDLAIALATLATSAVPYGIYHCTNRGQTTWYGLARAVFEDLGADVRRVIPVSTDDFPRPASRPCYSVLDAARWEAVGLPRMPLWREAVRRFLSGVPAGTNRPLTGRAKER